MGAVGQWKLEARNSKAMRLWSDKTAPIPVAFNFFET